MGIRGIGSIDKMEALSKIGGDYEFRVFEGNIELRALGTTFIQGKNRVGDGNYDERWPAPIGTSTAWSGSPQEYLVPQRVAITDLYVSGNNGSLNGSLIVAVTINGVATDLKVTMPTGAGATVRDIRTLIYADIGDTVGIVFDSSAASSGSHNGGIWAFRIVVLKE